MRIKKNKLNAGIQIFIIGIIIMFIINAIKINNRKQEEGISVADQLVEMKDEKNNEKINPLANEQDPNQVWFENFEVLFDYYAIDSVFKVEEYIQQYITKIVSTDSRHYVLDKESIKQDNKNIQFEFKVITNTHNDETVTVYLVEKEDKTLSITVVPQSLKE